MTEDVRYNADRVVCRVCGKELSKPTAEFMGALNWASVVPLCPEHNDPKDEVTAAVLPVGEGTPENGA